MWKCYNLYWIVRTLSPLILFSLSIFRPTRAHFKAVNKADCHFYPKEMQSTSLYRGKLYQDLNECILLSDNSNRKIHIISYFDSKDLYLKNVIYYWITERSFVDLYDLRNDLFDINNIKQYLSITKTDKCLFRVSNTKMTYAYITLIFRH